MNNESELPDTPEVFLVNLGNSLQKKEGVDTDLTEILRKYILTASPANDAVSGAKAAIIKLADNRANPKDAETQNG